MVSSNREVSSVGFQCRIRELGRGDAREGCRLVTAAGGSCLGVASHDALMAGGAAAQQLLQGEEGGFATLIFIIYPPKQRRFDIVFKKKLI